jgi:hypothetical protein
MGRNESRYIWAAILTIESEGSKPTFLSVYKIVQFIAAVSSNICLFNQYIEYGKSPCRVSVLNNATNRRYLYNKHNGIDEEEV